MKKIFKIIQIISSNFIIFLFLLLISDIFIFIKFYNNGCQDYDWKNFKYTFHTKPAAAALNINDTHFNGKNIILGGRTPDGLEYKGKSPILVFGCSYAFGMNLDKNKTFSYKLSQLTHRPVYNRAVSAQGIQFMYYQTTQDIFYKDVPKSNDAIFVMIYDHYRRLLSYFFNFEAVSMYPKYSLKNNELLLDKNENIIINYFKSSYTVRYLYHSYIKRYIDNSKNAEKLTDLVLFYFIKSRENMEKRWRNKINFTVIFYQDIPYSDILKEKLIKNGFSVIDTNEITEINLGDYKYKDPNMGNHPTEAAWDLLTPLIAEKLELKD